MAFLGHHHGAEIQELRGVAAVDLGYLADEVVQLGDLASDPDYQQGLGFYETARDALDAAREPEQFVAVCRALGTGRYGMARARARRDWTPEPPTAQPCFFDPAHGPAAQLMVWTPDGLDPRTVPVCAGDAEALAAGVEPDPRQVLCGDDVVAFWSAPDHFAYWFQGYFGNGEACYPVRLLAGLPLGRCFAEPAEDDEVFTAVEIFRRGPTGH
jgi:hypothetical protein